MYQTNFPNKNTKEILEKLSVIKKKPNILDINNSKQSYKRISWKNGEVYTFIYVQKEYTESYLSILIKYNSQKVFMGHLLNKEYMYKEGLNKLNVLYQKSTFIDTNNMKNYNVQSIITDICAVCTSLDMDKLNYFEGKSTKIYSTCVNGDIVLKTNGKKMNFTLQHNEDILNKTKNWRQLHGFFKRHSFLAFLKNYLVLHLPIFIAAFLIGIFLAIEMDPAAKGLLIVSSIVFCIYLERIAIFYLNNIIFSHIIFLGILEIIGLILNIPTYTNNEEYEVVGLILRKKQ
ncbi:MAG: hypothetical protein QW134_08810 [Nitrososphaeria archaeon]